MYAESQLKRGDFRVRRNGRAYVGAKLVALALAVRPDYAKAEQIAHDLGASRTTVYRWLTEARALGLITKSPKVRNRAPKSPAGGTTGGNAA